MSTTPQVTPIGSDALHRLHARSLSERREIIALLAEAMRKRQVLVGRRTVRGDAETARIVRVEDLCIALQAEHISAQVGEHVFLTFSAEGRSYFFAAVVDARHGSEIEIDVPTVLYVSERRDRNRVTPGESTAVPSEVELEPVTSRGRVKARVQDYSPVGMYVESPASLDAPVGSQVRLAYIDGTPRGSSGWGLVRHSRASSEAGWKRLGLATSAVPFQTPIEIERRRAIVTSGAIARARDSIAVLSAGIAIGSSRLLRRSPAALEAERAVNVTHYSNGQGGKLVGIVDRSFEQPGGIGVVIPPAWGRTKETLLPLAATIVQTFRQAGEAVAVLRFDGTCRRGESSKAPGFDAPGAEHLAFRLSQAVEDIIASAEYLTSDPEIRASRVILVTFSAASIEGRRALVEDRNSRLAGWVSVVGTPDLQSGMRTVSGGIDYVAGVEQGLRFGVQEVMGVATDIDGLIGEAVDGGLAFLEDARREMAQVSVPVTWIHGANDAWLDLERVREVMSMGATHGRRLIEVPTGHQLRTSREALEVFRLVAEECGRIALGRAVAGVLPRLIELEGRRLAERARMGTPAGDIRSFWRQYLLGREGKLGIELMNATHAYQELMNAQIEGLALTAGSRVADIGSGTGSFVLALAEAKPSVRGLYIDEIDYVPEAFVRARERLALRDLSGMEIQFVECDLDSPSERQSVLREGTYDAVLMSLVLSYLRDPLAVLKDVSKTLRPGGRIVVSTLHRDADISRLYLESVDELRRGRARTALGVEGEKLVAESVRTFLNDMARILDLEEAGVFQFLDGDDVMALLSDAGFVNLRSAATFGNPAQAVVVSGVSPV